MKPTLVGMSSRKLAKALEPKNIKFGFTTTCICPIDITSMDSKLDSETIHEREKTLEGRQISKLIPIHLEFSHK